MKKISKINLLSKLELEIIVNSSRTLQEVLRKIGYSSYSGANRKYIQNKIDELKISTAHFTKSVGSGEKRSIENVFCINTTATQKVVREWYLKCKFSLYQCSICGQGNIWLNKPLSLTLDHIDGNNLNNTISNLRWVCPNCDRQLPTFGSKNKRKTVLIGDVG